MTASRREFIKTAGHLAGVAWAGSWLPAPLLSSCSPSTPGAVPLSGHIWIYASQYPPDWDCTPMLEEVFSDFRYAGLQGLELMEIHLRHADVVPRVGALIEQYKVPVTGVSYYGDMWNRTQHSAILDDVALVVERLHQLGGSTFGITVGDAGRIKTEAELDAQAELLHQVLRICTQHQVEPNLHNHTFEVANNLHDLKGTLDRVPELKLGPDLNWLIRGGVDPVEFIRTYGERMVYLHLRDQDANGKWTNVVGQGVTDFEGIAQALQEVNFKGRAAIELAFETPPSGSVREEWKQSRDYVKEVFGW
ncbi:sugar phosphate isomerase/epimerase [Rhabdobacter roseus]|uniref:Sugar phosphate isomerase/epimerase n=1 Tax=Rhabdobacter roseus TaxID=1655419 RepID=A0A840TSN1_9BACT|nr:TIM barrel protein [Rhabdobacter roseus]MBB5287386.1 sugar phosphate isomerase/epimerase [Rhabdobacter roseus]